MAATTTPRTRISPALPTLILLIALNLLNYIDRYILPGELSLVQNEFHATREQMGALTTAMFIVYMLAAPLTGWLGDRYRRKPLIIAGAVLWSLATLSHRLGPQLLDALLPPRHRRHRRSLLRHLRARRHCRLLPRARPQPHPLHLLHRDSRRRRPRLHGRRTDGIDVGLAATVLHLRHSRPHRRRALRIPRQRARARRQDHIKPTTDRATFAGLFRNPAFLTATFGLAMLTFAMGGISNWIPEFLHNPIGLSVAKASQLAGASTVIDGILGTAIGGWIAQRWLRTNHRALYLLSFWSVALTLPFGILLFFGPGRWAIPALFAAEFFLFLNTGPLNTAIVNSVSAPVRATAVSVNLFCIHFFGDTFSPQIIGKIADHSTLRIGLGSTLIFLVLSCIILLIGSRFAPSLADELDPPQTVSS